MSSALPKVLSQRGKTQSELERENFEKFQTVSIQKAINNVECPVKEKHVRTAIIGTFQDGGGNMFWSVTDKLQLQGNPIVCWKFCYTLHKLMRDGHVTVIPESQKFTSRLTDLGKLWGHLKDSYGKLIKLYTKFLNQKLAFHKKYPQCPGTLKLDDDEFGRMCGGDVDGQFEVSVDMMDYMDDILALQAGVFGSLDMSRSNSMTASGQCRLAPLVLFILESALLYDYIVKLLFKLHSSLPVDTLAGHRTRFSQQFKGLTQFFYSSKNLQYYKNLIQVPNLPEQAPNFLIASELHHHARPMAVVPAAAEVEVDSLVDTAEPPPPAVPDRFDSMARFSDDDKRDRHMHEMTKEIEALRRRLRTMDSDSHFELNQCTEELRRKTKEADSMKSLLEQMAAERDQLISEKNVLAEDLEARIETAQKTTSASDEKFKKMKDIYNKLREEHLNLLRSNGDVQKQLKKMKLVIRDKDQEIVEIVGQLELAKNERSMMQETMQQSGNTNNEIVEAKAVSLQLEQEKNDLLTKLQSAEQAKQSAEEALSANEEAVKELEMVKMNMEVQIRDLEERVGDADTKTSAMTDDLKSLEHQVAELTSREEKAKNDLLASQKSFSELQNSVTELQAQLISQSEQAKIEAEDKERNTVIRALEECISVIEDRARQFEEPSIFALRCSPEFLIERIEPTRDGLNTIKDILQNFTLSSSASELLKSISAICYRISDCMIFGEAMSHSTPVEYSETLANLSRHLGPDAIKIFNSIIGLLNRDGSAPDFSSIEENLNSMLDIAEKVRPKIRDVKAEEIGEMVEQEMLSTTTAIEAAASHFEELLANSRTKDTGVQLEVNERIIDSCTDLVKNIRVLIEKSRTLQKEIVATGRGASSVEDYYKKHSRWTEGLISAAKSVAFAANALLGSADDVVKGEGKFEELIVCSQEIAASTTQLVVASQVKAEAKSKALQDLKKASSTVMNSTGNVVANAKSCAKMRDEVDMQDLSNISLTQSKRMEMNSQVKVIELETALANERVKLAELRKKHYQLAGESEGWDEEDINNATA